MRNRNRGLHRFQIRIMLDYLGCPIDDQPKSMKETKNLFFAFKTKSPDQYEVIHDIVVNGKLPEGSGNDDENRIRDFTKLMSSQFGDFESSARKQIATCYLSEIEKATRASEELAATAIRSALDQFKTIKVKVGNKKAKKIDGVLPDEYESLVQLAQQRKNIFITGPAGCGKTYVASKIAEGLELQFSSQSCSAGMSESMLTGWLLPIGESGRFHYVASEFIRIYEEGGIFLLDEMDAADPNVLVFMNNALSGKSFTLPQRFENPLVKKHDDFVCIAAANTMGNGANAIYHGRNALDGSTMDRFRAGIIQMDYSDSVEDMYVNPELLNWGRGVRAKIKSHRMLKIMSTRLLIDGTEMMNGQGWSIDKVKMSYYSDWSSEEKLMLGESK